MCQKDKVTEPIIIAEALAIKTAVLYASVQLLCTAVTTAVDSSRQCSGIWQCVVQGLDGAASQNTGS